MNEAPDFWAQPTAEIADRQHQSFMGWMAARGGGGNAHWRYGTGMDGSSANPVTGVAQGFTTTDPALIAQLLTDPDARARYRKAANRGYYWEYSHTSYTAHDGTHTVVGHSKKVWLREDGKGGEGENSHYSLFFNGSRLMVVDETNGSVPYSTRATSGKGEHMNNPKSQSVQDRGPIPSGNYFFINTQWQSQSILRQIYNLFAGNGDWGDHNVPLTPIVPGARGNFYLHGGFFDGSRGCIDVGENIGIIYNYQKQQTKTILRVRY